jgi:hypothetical protein
MVLSYDLKLGVVIPLALLFLLRMLAVVLYIDTYYALFKNRRTFHNLTSWDSCSAFFPRICVVENSCLGALM